MKTMAALDRKVHYLDSEHDRESSVLQDQAGNELNPADAIERFGGKDAAYVEVVSDASALETQALLVRHPDRDPEKVMGDHFRAQMAKLDPFGKSIMAMHGESDGSFHAHFIMPRDRDYGRLEGRFGKLQAAWDKVWRDGQDRYVVDGNSRNEALEIKEDLAKIRGENKALSADRKALKDEKSPHKRVHLREDLAAKAEALELRQHETQIRYLDALYRSRGQREGLEHQVELATEESRHTGATRANQRERFGLDRNCAMKLDPRDVSNPLVRLGVHARGGGQDAFRHLSPERRREVRLAALLRELDVLQKKHDAELASISDREELLARHSNENKAVLLRFEIGCLRDKEGSLRGGLNRSATTWEKRRNFMAQRHGLERAGLDAQAKALGRTEPKPEAVKKLTERQAKEREVLLGEPAAMLAWKAHQRLRSMGRSIVVAPGKAIKDLSDRALQASGARSMDPLSRDIDRIDASVRWVLAAAGTAIARTALTAVIEIAKLSIHEIPKIAGGASVLGRAIATGIVTRVAGAKEAGRGLSKIGKGSFQSLAKDMKGGGKAVGMDASNGARETSSQTISGVGSPGLGATHLEIQVAVGIARGSLKAAMALMRLDLVSTASSAGQGTIQVAGETTKGIRGRLGALGTPLDLAAKLPLLGMIAIVAKLSTELGAGAGAEASKSKSADIELDR